MPSTPPGPSYNGNPSSFGSITALGGGNGGGYPNPIIHIDKEDLVDLVVEPRGIRLTVLLIEVVLVRQVDLEHLGQGNPGGYGGCIRTYSPGNKPFVAGGGGGAGGSGGNSSYPNYNAPQYPPSSYPVPTWSGWNATGGDGGNGKPNTAFSSTNLAGYVPEPAFPS